MTAAEWADLVASIKHRNDRRAVSRRVWEELLDELGFVWADGGMLGPICLQLVTLSPEQREVFNAEHARRVNAALEVVRDGLDV